MNNQLPYQLLASLEGVKGYNENTFKAVHEATDRVTSIRINPAKVATIDLLEYETTPVPWCDNGFYLMERPVFTLNPFIHAGGFYVQEASSMFIWNILNSLQLPDNLKVLDLCAAPGGKSTLLSTYFKNGVVVCNEVIQSRAAILVENTVKWGNDNTVVTNNDPKQFANCKELFDVIILDAPCSGSGMFRKDNAAIEEWSTDNVYHCSQRQERILNDILPALKSGGILVYSTCSYSKEEDEDIIDYIIENNELTSIKIHCKDDWNIVETNADKTNGFGYRFFPDKVKGEGFFVAVFKKGTEELSSSDYLVAGNKKADVSKAEVAVLNSFISIPEGYEFIKNRESILALPSKHITFLQFIINNLYIKRIGIELGIIKGKDFIPSHHLALSKLSDSYKKRIEVDEETALNFQRKADIKVNGEKGWNLICYKNLPLGWIKVLPNRINNYYPSEWRIIKL